MAAEIWGQDSLMTSYCAFCPGLKFEGTAREVAELCREHRAQEHPDLPPPTRRRRANLSGWRSRLSESEGSEIQVERTRRMRLLGIDQE